MQLISIRLFLPNIQFLQKNIIEKSMPKLILLRNRF